MEVFGVISIIPHFEQLQYHGTQTLIYNTMQVVGNKFVRKNFVVGDMKWKWTGENYRKEASRHSLFN
jgi:hypothetical protein